MWRSSDGAVARHGGAGRRARVREAPADEGAGRGHGGQIKPEPRDFGSGVTEGDPGDHGRGCRVDSAAWPFRGRVAEGKKLTGGVRLPVRGRGAG